MSDSRSVWWTRKKPSGRTASSKSWASLMSSTYLRARREISGRVSGWTCRGEDPGRDRPGDHTAVDSHGSLRGPDTLHRETWRGSDVAVRDRARPRPWMSLLGAPAGADRHAPRPR